jgi:hypothetical protein
MKNIVENAHKSASVKHLFRQGFYSGIGWAIGVTLGFALISTIIVALFSRLGGLPLIGSWIASIVSATTEQLSNRTPILPPVN